MRLRLKMSADITRNIRFHGGVTVERCFGAGIVDPIFNGGPLPAVVEKLGGLPLLGVRHTAGEGEGGVPAAPPSPRPR